MRIARFIFPILLTIVSCDTERSFNVPEENYFVKYYGEEGEQTGVDFVVNPDGTIVMVGNTERPGVLSQIYVVKVDANGHELWNRKFGLPDKKDWVKDVELHPDGRIVIVGETEMEVGNKDVYIRTISQDGVPLDSARHGLKKGSIETDEEVNSVSIINGGAGFSAGFIVTGSTTNVVTADARDLHDALFLRFDGGLVRIKESGPDPISIWGPPSYGYNSDDIAYKSVEVDASTIYVFGYSNRITGSYNGDYNFWYFALSGNATPKLNENYIGKASENEQLTSVEIANSNLGIRYILSGTAASSGTVQSYVVGLSSQLSFDTPDIRLENNSTVLAATPNDLLKVKVIGSINGSFLSISSDSRIGNQGFNIALTRLNGNAIRQSEPLIFGGEGDDFAGSVAELPNGRILLMGTMTIGQSSTAGQKKMVLLKLNSEGKLAE